MPVTVLLCSKHLSVQVDLGLRVCSADRCTALFAMSSHWAARAPQGLQTGTCVPGTGSQLWMPCKLGPWVLASRISGCQRSLALNQAPRTPRTQPVETSCWALQVSQFLSNRILRQTQCGRGQSG